MVENTSRAIGMSGAPGHVPVNGENVVTHEGKCFPLGLLWDQHTVQSSRFRRLQLRSV